MSDGSSDLYGDPSTVSQIDTGCVPGIEIVESAKEDAERLSGRKIADFLPTGKKLLRLLQSDWGRELRRKGKWLLITGKRIFIVKRKLYEDYRERRRRQRK